jgi:hypothetical protein
MNIALDIDGTITKLPEFFAILSRAIRQSGGKVFIVTSRANSAGVRDATKEELASYGIAFDELFIIPDAGREQIPCPHGDLDWYQKYLWQKVAVCLERDVAIVFEDDDKVIALFKTYAPDIQVFRVE